MKGLGVFSPSSATSRYVLVASGLYESSGSGTPRGDAAPVSLNLMDFKISEKPERASDPFSNNFDGGAGLGQYAQDAPFSFGGANFGDYMTTQYNTGIAEFSLLHSTPFNLPNGHLSTMKWIKLGPPYEEDRTLLAVGNNVGDVFFYDSDVFVSSKALVATYSSNVCMVPVKCLGYCGKNMLGVAGLDGQVSVVDLSDQSSYHVLDVSYGKWKVGLVTSLSWNYRLPHILASSGAALVPSDTSGVVVWDLKVRKPASTFRDPGGRVNPVALDWVPDQPTQLVVGYADDNAPALQLWDLRNCSAPLSEVRAHTRGLTDLRFSPHDPNLLLTSAKDDSTKCWHLTPERSFELVSSLQTEALSHHARVEWHPNAPGLFLSQANDGNLCVHHLFSGVVESSYMPLWSRRKAGLAVGFAGQVVAWTSTEVRDYTLSTQYDAHAAEVLESTLEVLKVLHDEALFAEFCDSKAAAAADERERLTWSVLRSQYRGELRDLLEVLGYADRPEPASEESLAPEARAPDLMAFSNLVPTTSNHSLVSNRTRSLSEDTTQDDKEAEDFFNSLTLNTPNLLEMSHARPGAEAFGSRSSADEPCRPESAEDLPEDDRLEWTPDRQLRHSLVRAEYQEAARRCMDLNKVVEALLLSYVAGQEAFLELVERVVRSRRDPFLNLVHLVMQNDLERVLTSSSLGDWKDTLCLLYRYSEDADYFRDLALRFGKRLHELGHQHEASVCYILAGEYLEVAALWRAGPSGHATPASHAPLSGRPLATPHSAGTHRGSGRLEDRMEMLLKLAVLAFSTSSPGQGYSVGAANFDAVLVELSEVFVDAGQLHKALETLNVEGASNSNLMLQLKSKIENQIRQLEAESAPVDPQPHPQGVQQYGAHATHTAHPATPHLVTAHPATSHPATSHPATSHPASSTVGGGAGYGVPGYGQPAGTHYAPSTPGMHGGTPTTTSAVGAASSYQRAHPNYQGAHAVYQPGASYQQTQPAHVAPQQMTSTTTRTVPTTALQMAPTQSAPSVASTLTQSTAVPASLAASHMPSSASQYSGQQSNITPYTSLSHTTSNSSYGPGAAHAASTPVSQVATAAPVYASQPAQTFNAVSSAPGAVAGALNPGMPIPWPNPTPTQQLSSKTVGTQQSNKLIVENAQPAPKGEKMGKADLDLVVSTLHSLVANLGESRVDQDSRKHVAELVAALNQGALSAEANALLATLCRAVSNGDLFNSNVVLNNIVSKLWNNQNKPWIMCLKRLVPK